MNVGVEKSEQMKVWLLINQPGQLEVQSFFPHPRNKLALAAPIYSTPEKNKNVMTYSKA